MNADVTYYEQTSHITMVITNPSAQNEDIKLLQQDRLIGQHKLHKVDDRYTR